MQVEKKITKRGTSNQAEWLLILRGHRETPKHEWNWNEIEIELHNEENEKNVRNTLS